MREGLLWFDTDRRRQPGDKLDQAAARFAERFRKPPNTCHVHPDELFEHPTIRVVANPAVLRGHFWVGLDESQVQPRRRRRSA